MLTIRRKSSLIHKIRIGLFSFTALTLAFVGVSGVLSTAQAAPGTIGYTEVPFTSDELTNWTPDRTAPSGGASSVSFVGRDNVLQLGVVGANRSASTSFYYTEGIQRQLPDATVAVKADLYVDSAWLATDVRAGIWGVGHDATSTVSAYPIVEFTTADDFTGWRYWDGAVGWVNLPGVAYNTNSWNTLEVVFNADTQEFDGYVNGQLVASSDANGTVEVGAVILNSYNYGSTSTDYAVRWSKFAYGKLLANPTSKDACKGSGWTQFGFKNQGACIQYVNTGKDSRS